MTDEALARAIRDHYIDHRDDTLAEVAEALGEPEDRVTRILDTYTVKDTGGVEEVGPGGGGGWIPE